MINNSQRQALSWFAIVRLGLVQTALGAIVVLCLSVMNRVMVVELGLTPLVPGLLIGWHHALQLTRPALGHRSDVKRQRTPWILLGMTILAVGGIVSASSLLVLATSFWFGIAVAVLGYSLIGAGVGLAGTTLLAMLASSVSPDRRASAAAIVWLMMIAGFIVTTALTADLLEPFSTARLLTIVSSVAGIAWLVAAGALVRLETPANVKLSSQRDRESHEVETLSGASLREAAAELWADRQARVFTLFVFLAMFAYGMQDLILEPFAGSVFHFSPSDSTRLSSQQYQGVFWGMILAGVFAGRYNGRFGSVRRWTFIGCIASGAALLGLCFGAWNSSWPLSINVVTLGLANGVFAVAAIGWMMALAGGGQAAGEGSRMGLWGGAQAVGTALGGSAGTMIVSAALEVFDATPAPSYGAAFAIEGALFFLAALLVLRMQEVPRSSDPTRSSSDLVLKGARV